MNEKEIRKLINIVQETGIHELEIKKLWGKRIRIVRNGVMTSANIPETKSEVHTQTPQKSESPESPEKDFSQYTEVRSPMVGTFYRAPAPGEAPFVSRGDSVRTGQTMCIIEAMKVMNEIEAEVSGTIVEILVENSQPVEFNQPLFYIDERQ
ncbi:acetyl-CoA carboxylase biotin carboxyl carrier protein [candidate division KSB1 bacterium]